MFHGSCESSGNSQSRRAAPCGMMDQAHSTRSFQELVQNLPGRINIVLVQTSPQLELLEEPMDVDRLAEDEKMHCEEQDDPMMGEHPQEVPKDDHLPENVPCTTLCYSEFIVLQRSTSQPSAPPANHPRTVPPSNSPFTQSSSAGGPSSSRDVHAESWRPGSVSFDTKSYTETNDVRCSAPVQDSSTCETSCCKNATWRNTNCCGSLNINCCCRRKMLTKTKSVTECSDEKEAVGP